MSAGANKEIVLQLAATIATDLLRAAGRPIYLAPRETASRWILGSFSWPHEAKMPPMAPMDLLSLMEREESGSLLTREEQLTLDASRLAFVVYHAMRDAIEVHDPEGDGSPEEHETWSRKISAEWAETGRDRCLARIEIGLSEEIAKLVKSFATLYAPE